jgi:hypothetical protein
MRKTVVYLPNYIETKRRFNALTAVPVSHTRFTSSIPSTERTYLGIDILLNGSWDSSVSTVSDYRLDDWAIGLRSPAEAKDFSCSLCVETSSEDHPASYPMGTRGPFPVGKGRPGRDPDHSSHLVPRSRMSRSYHLSPLVPCMAVAGHIYF